ncbi:MAG: PCI domain-containing protein [Promethearchaeota archaeon]
MSEKVDIEFGKKGEWFISSYDPNLGLKKSIGVAFSKSGWKKKSLGYGNLIIEPEKISLGAFELPFVNVVNIEKDNKFDCILLHDTDEKHYCLWIYTRSYKVRREETGKVLSALSEKRNIFKKQDMIEKSSDAKEFIKSLPKLYKEITLDDIASRTGVARPEVIEIIENLIINGELKAEIRGNMLILRKEPEITMPEPILQTQESLPSMKFEPKELSVLRGGDWKVEGNQSIFYYKVKVKNDSPLVVSNIQILLTSIPRGLDTQSQMYKIESLKPGSFESPTFKFFAKESCVGDIVEGLVSFTDPTGNQQTAQIEPFEICYVCNLLTPKQITREEFEEKVDFMEEKKLIIDSDMEVSALESKITQIIKNCNFALLQEMQDSQSETLKKLDAFAQGLYDKQDVALSVTVKKMEEGSKLVVKAMSDRSEKVTDLLRDFNGKLDDIKSDTELIKQYTSQIEDLFDELGKLENIEAYLKDHLGSDWEKLKYAWEDYKAGNINRKQLIWQGVKVIGKRFIPKILAKFIPFIESKI